MSRYETPIRSMNSPVGSHGRMRASVTGRSSQRSVTHRIAVPMHAEKQRIDRGGRQPVRRAGAIALGHRRARLRRRLATFGALDALEIFEQVAIERPELACRRGRLCLLLRTGVGRLAADRERRARCRRRAHHRWFVLLGRCQRGERRPRVLRGGRRFSHVLDEQRQLRRRGRGGGRGALRCGGRGLAVRTSAAGTATPRWRRIARRQVRRAVLAASIPSRTRDRPRARAPSVRNVEIGQRQRPRRAGRARDRRHRPTGRSRSCGIAARDRN